MRLAAGVVFAVLARCFTSGAAAAPLDVYDGFETPGLSNVWATDRFEAGAVEIQTKLFRAGRAAAKIVVRPHAKFEAGSAGSSDSERGELR
jgi:hypothetical protein